MGFITLTQRNTNTSIPIRVKSIDENPQIKNIVKPFIGSEGSSTQKTGTGGRLLTLNAVARNEDISTIKALSTLNDYITVTSISYADYNGEYYIIDPFTSTEKKPGVFDVTIKLQERGVFNTIYANFTTYDVSTTGFTPTLKIGDKWSPS